MRATESADLNPGGAQKPLSETLSRLPLLHDDPRQGGVVYVEDAHGLVLVRVERHAMSVHRLSP